MSTVAASCAVVIAVIAVLVTTTTFAATPPSVTTAPFKNPVPETRISEATLVGPTVGETAATVSPTEGAAVGAREVGAEGIVVGNLSQAAVSAASARTPPATVRAK